MQFARFDPAAFLRDTWQRRPLLIRNPWAAWANPLEPDELAGLACESEVESRLVVCAGAELAVEHGPLAEDRFATLGAEPWTLLVQAVDHHVPDVAALIAAFRFIPNWRIDDVMVSFATTGGGVGPHFDQYDVFLIQGLGRRRWRLGPVCDDATKLALHDDLRLLEGFETTEEWVLEPGDVLYLPPGVAHEGVALSDDCMTYSIGFRAPSRRDLVSGWCDEVLATLADDDRYADPGLALPDNPGEITPAALSRLQAMVAERLLDAPAFADWFGRTSSTPRYPEVDWSPDAALTPAALRRAMKSGAALHRNPASRFSFIAGTGDAITLYVDGTAHPCTGDAAALARQLAARDTVALPPALSPDAQALVQALHDRGSIALDGG